MNTLGKRMNKKGFTPLTIIFIDIFFIIMWVYFLADMFTTYGQAAITNGGLTGIEAFIWSNINAFVGFCFLILNVASLYFFSQ